MVINLIKKPLIQIVFLLALVVVCFGKTVHSYFLADDIWQTAYIAEIVNGHWLFLWKNFVGNFMDIASSAVYRPLVVVSMVIDFVLWKTNAAGWFVSNLLFYATNVVLVYLVARLLSKGQNFNSAPFLAACLFAVCPLHGEPVCWLAGRSDLICSMFFLLSFYCLLCADRKMAGFSVIAKGRLILWLFSILLFCLALLAKEMAAILPAVVFAYFLLLSDRAETSFRQRIWQAVVRSLPYWLSLLVYLRLRAEFIGTLFGGYTDGLALQVQGTWLSRQLDWHNAYRLFFPLGESLTHGSLVGPSLLGLCYLIAIFSLRRSNPRTMVFLFFWFIFALLPILPMWGLGPDLKTSRLYFFASTPLSIFLAFALAALPARKLGWLTATLIAVIWLTSARAISTNWTDAGREVSSIREQALALAQSSTGRFIVFPLPKEKNDALMLTNGNMFMHLLEPPFSKRSYRDRFIVFDRIFSEPDAIISASRLKAALAKPGNDGPYLWQDNKFRLLPLVRSKDPGREISISPDEVSINSLLNPSQAKIRINDDNSLTITNYETGDFVCLSPPSINPLKTDFLIFDLDRLDRQIPKEPNDGQNLLEHVAAVWDIPTISADRGWALAYFRERTSHQTILFPLSHYWRWYGSPAINKIWLQLPPTKSMTLRNLRFLPAQQMIPKMQALDLVELPLATFYVANAPVRFWINCEEIKNVAGYDIQVSRPNYFFANFEQDTDTAVVRRDHFPNKQGIYKTKAFEFVVPGYYQIRCRAVDSQAKPVGTWSDPLTLFRPPY